MKISISTPLSEIEVRKRLERVLRDSPRSHGLIRRIEGIVTWNDFSLIAPRSVLWDGVRCTGRSIEKGGVTNVSFQVEYRAQPVYPIVPLALGLITVSAVYGVFAGPATGVSVRAIAGFAFVLLMMVQPIRAACSLSNIVRGALEV
jgi:hypothetical protein